MSERALPDGYREADMTFGVGGCPHPEWRQSGAALLPARFRFVGVDEGRTEFVVTDADSGEPIEPGASGDTTLPHEGRYILWTRQRPGRQQ